MPTRCKTPCLLLMLLFGLSACAQLSTPRGADMKDAGLRTSRRLSEYEDDEADYVDEGYFEEQVSSDGGGWEMDEESATHYENVLPRRWRPAYSLDYSEGNFTFPPVSGHRVLHYEDPRTDTRLDMYRELIKSGTYMDIITRRQAADHCAFNDSSYRKLKDIEIVKATANCYVWLEGDYLRKYYFIKVGEVVYTFRLLSPSSEYIFAEADFDYFVNNTLEKYLVHSPRRQSSLPEAGGQQAASAPGYNENLRSFFSP